MNLRSRGRHNLPLFIWQVWPVGDWECADHRDPCGVCVFSVCLCPPGPAAQIVYYIYFHV